MDEKRHQDIQNLHKQLRGGGIFDIIDGIKNLYGGGLTGANDPPKRPPRNIPSGPILPVAQFHVSQVQALLTGPQFHQFVSEYGQHNFYNQNIVTQFIQNLHQQLH